MSKGQETRERLITAAARLFEAQGYAATGLTQILEESGAPRGSLYFHFPEGKEQLAVAVVAAHAAGWAAVMNEVSRVCPTALQAASMILDILAERFESTKCEGGCPVTAVAFEIANRSPRLREAARGAYETWAAIVSEKLQAEGFTVEQAQQRARVSIASIEGALIVGRAFGDATPLRDLKAILPELLER